MHRVEVRHLELEDPDAAQQERTGMKASVQTQAQCYVMQIKTHPEVPNLDAMEKSKEL